MIFVILCVIIIAVSLILYGRSTSDESNIFMMIAAGLIVLTIMLLIKIIPCKIDYNKDQAKAELQAKYSAITAALEKDSSNYLLFSENIAEYNAAVLKGRRSMDDFFFHDFDYDFYYDLELIEI